MKETDFVCPLEEVENMVKQKYGTAVLESIKKAWETSGRKVSYLEFLKKAYRSMEVVR